MSYFRDFQYNLSEVTAICIDNTNGNFLWVAFAEVDGACVLQKVSAFDVSQVYYTVSVPVNSINSMVVVNGFVFLAVTHATIFTFAYSISNPLTTFTYINKPGGVIESSVKVVLNPLATVLYFLTPGVNSASPAQIVLVSNSNVYQSTITLIESGLLITNASSLTVNTTTGDIWVVTNTNPVQLVRVYLLTNGSYAFTETNI